MAAIWSWIFRKKEPPPRSPPPRSPPPSPSPPPPPPPEFDQPWRDMKWDQKNILEEKLRNFKPSNPGVQQVRILLVGPVGAGKSSFINSVNNAFQGRITSGALVAATSGKSFTKAYKSHYIEGKDGKHLSFVFNDIMGLEQSTCGISEHDVVKAIRGFVPESYNFEEESKNLSKNDPKYRSNPELKDQTFCLVNILPADKISLMDQRVIEQMKYVREQASDLNLPQVIILTKPDEACPLVQKNLRKIYTSKKIKEKMQECSNLLGLPMNHIFPLKNYHEEMDTEDDIDVLILKALDQIINIANDALNISPPESWLSWIYSFVVARFPWLVFWNYLDPHQD